MFDWLSKGLERFLDCGLCDRIKDAETVLCSMFYDGPPSVAVSSGCPTVACSSTRLSDPRELTEPEVSTQPLAAHITLSTFSAEQLI